MNMYEILDSTGKPVTGAMSYTEALRYMQKNRLTRNEYTIALYVPTRATNGK